MADDSLRQMLQEITQIAGQKRRAVYIPSNPSELNEYWQMVFDENEENCLRQVVHERIPVSQFDQQAQKLVERYGAITVLGDTYDHEPHDLGVKRYGDTERARTQETLQMLANEMGEDAASTLSAMDGFLREMTEEESIKAAERFYQSNPANDARSRNAFVRMIKGLTL